MITRLTSRLGAPLAWTASVVGALVLLVGVGRAIPQQPVVGVVVALAVLGLGLMLADPTIIPLLTIPVMLVVTRVGAGGVDLSVSDVVLFVAFWPAVAFGHRPFSAALRSLLWLVATYQVATLFTLVANPYLANLVEWFHAALLTGGALVVGWAIARAGRGGLALMLLLVGVLVIAGGTLLQAVTHPAQALQAIYPQYPFPMHKNFAGTVLGFGALIAYVHPSWMRAPRWLSLAVFTVCGIALLLTQSRQAIVGLAVALAVVVFRTDSTRRRSKLVVLGGVAALVVVASLVRDQVASGNQFNSVFQRLNWFQASLDVWQNDPVVGVGLRWWYTDRFEYQFQPPNAEMEVLTSAGVVGLAAFFVLIAGVLVALWRLPPQYGTLAVTIVLSRFVQGQFDLFWIAVQVSVPFVVVGLCLGEHARASEPGALPQSTPDRAALAVTHPPT